MASSSQRGAGIGHRRRPTSSPPSTSWWTKKVIAGALCRHARDAELSASVAVQAEALYGHNSLVVANLRLEEIRSLINLGVEASGAERVSLLSRAWVVHSSVLPLLLRRIEANTLLPGSMMAEELDYDAHVQAAVRKATNEPVPSPARLRALVCDRLCLSSGCHESKLGLIAAAVVASRAEEDGGVVCAPRAGRHSSNSRHNSKCEC